MTTETWQILDTVATSAIALIALLSVPLIVAAIKNNVPNEWILRLDAMAQYAFWFAEGVARKTDLKFDDEIVKFGKKIHAGIMSGEAKKAEAVGFMEKRLGRDLKPKEMDSVALTWAAMAEKQKMMKAIAARPTLLSDADGGAVMVPGNQAITRDD